MRSTTFSITLILCLTLLSGCGDNKNPFGTVYLEGVVTVDGEPMQSVSVTLIPKSGGDMSAGGITDAKGKFTVTTGGAPTGSGAKPGEYDITFTKIQMEGSDMPEEERARRFGNSMPPMVHVVPQIYGDPKTSGIAPITVETNKSKNKYNFDLKTK